MNINVFLNMNHPASHYPRGTNVISLCLHFPLSVLVWTAIILDHECNLEDSEQTTLASPTRYVTSCSARDSNGFKGELLEPSS